jgi:hypothetical protein
MELGGGAPFSSRFMAGTALESAQAASEQSKVLGNLNGSDLESVTTPNWAATRLGLFLPSSSAPGSENARQEHLQKVWGNLWDLVLPFFVENQGRPSSSVGQHCGGSVLASIVSL